MRPSTLALLCAFTLAAAFALAVIEVRGGSLTHPMPNPDVCKDFTPYGRPVEAVAHAQTVICNTAYVVGYNDKYRTYDWAAWPLTHDHAIGCLARKNQFHTDRRLTPLTWSTPDDFLKTGFDMGHAADDMDMTWEAEVQTESFLMSNMAPQAPGLNRQGWEQLEADTRDWAVQGLGGDTGLKIYVYSVWGANPATIGDDHVGVPDAFAKVIYSPVKQQAIAVIMPNAPVAKGVIDMYVVAVADVERAAKMTVPLPDGLDKTHVTLLWPTDPRGYLKTKQRACKA